MSRTLLESGLGRVGNRMVSKPHAGSPQGERTDEPRTPWRAWAPGRWLAGAGLGIAAVLTVALVPSATARFAETWPWMHRASLLLSGLSMIVVLLAAYLTQRHRHLLRLQNQLTRLREVELAHAQQRAQALQRRMEDQTRATREQADELERLHGRLNSLFRLVREFSGGFAHEFRTPLTVIKETVSSLREEPLDAEQQGHLDRVLHRIDDIDTLVDDLLDVTRIEAGTLRTFRRRCSISDITQSLFPKLERRACTNHVRLTLRVEPELPEVFCDPENVARIISNLVANALKFSPEGGHATVEAAPHTDGRQVMISVRDDGPGIDRQSLAAIFEPFRQLREPPRSSTKGLGVGLHVVRELVHSNLGRIDVQSVPGEGSTFSFTLPRAEPHALVEHYVMRLRGFEGGGHAVSLLAARSSATDEPSAVAFEQGIHRTIRRTDLLLCPQPGLWMVLAVTDRAGVRHLLRRLATQCSVLDDRASDARMHVAWSIEGTWSAHDACNTLLQRIDSICDRGDPVAQRAPV